jgi:hypothetical protein
MLGYFKGEASTQQAFAKPMLAAGQNRKLTSRFLKSVCRSWIFSFAKSKLYVGCLHKITANGEGLLLC